MQKIGRVFTPIYWARWLVQTSGAFDRWREGGTILDPTCGEGVFLEAFIAEGYEKGCLNQAAVDRLFGNELIASDRDVFLRRIANKYRVTFPPSNFTTFDFFHTRIPGRFSCVVGNPPWANFSDLQSESKEGLKDVFVRYGLVLNKKDVLLGGSRADIAALVVQKAIAENLEAGSIAAFWLPKSVFFNESANKNFRAFRLGTESYCCEKLYLFDDARKAIFPDIATPYCAAIFKKGANQLYPVSAYQYAHSKGWTQCFVAPSPCDILGGWRQDAAGDIRRGRKVMLHISQKPRQGINTCGANDVFIFERAEDVDESERSLTNGRGQVFRLPKALTFPLVTQHSFRGHLDPVKWIFVPHDPTTGRPLSVQQLRQYESANDYLAIHKKRLEARRGVLIQSLIRRGLFWSLLGVGSYSFSPWKVIWESYGKKEFKAIKLPGEWQGNQAMHAFIPCDSACEADRILKALAELDVQSELLRYGMEGTTNWAQPGRMARMFEFSGTLI